VEPINCVEEEKRRRGEEGKDFSPFLPSLLFSSSINILICGLLETP
jgi:hypothetical protein